MGSKIRDAEKMKQGVSFDGFQWGKIYPTDCDMYLELEDKLFVFGELKYCGVDIPTGQRIALQNAVNAINANEGKRAYLLKIDWTEDNLTADDMVDLATCKISRVFHGRWRTPPMPLTSLISQIRSPTNDITANDGILKT